MTICETIQERVLKHFDVNALELHSRNRTERVAWPRQIVMHLAMSCGVSSTESAKFFGRGHATALHAQKTVKSRMATESDIRILVEYMEKQILRKLAPEAMEKLNA